MTERERKLRMLTLIPFFARRLVSGRTARALVACLMLVAGHAAHAAIPIQHWQHASGAKVYLVESPVIPMLDVQIDVDGGSRRDPAGQAGLASATADMLSAGTLAHEGQSALDEHQLAEAWTDLGASFGAEVSGERFTLSLRTLTEPALLRQAVALAARQMAVPAWPGPVWQRDRERWAQALREADMRPGTHADRAFGQAVYGDHPLGRPTTPETLAAFGVDDMRAFYRQHVAACRANVTLVGAINRQTADDIVGRLISAIAPNGCPRLAPVPAVEPLQAGLDLVIACGRVTEPRQQLSQHGFVEPTGAVFTIFPVGNDTDSIRQPLKILLDHAQISSSPAPLLNQAAALRCGRVPLSVATAAPSRVSYNRRPIPKALVVAGLSLKLMAMTSWVSSFIRHRATTAFSPSISAPKG